MNTLPEVGTIWQHKTNATSQARVERVANEVVRWAGLPEGRKDHWGGGSPISHFVYAWEPVAEQMRIDV